jgi:gluconate 2-dehydrogenase alpha chain
MATKLKGTDVVVIGMGATGGIAAYALAKAGVDVIGLEAGPRWTQKDFPFDEIRNDIRKWLGRGKQNAEVPSFRRNSSQVAAPPVASGVVAGPMMNGVGGASIHYTAQSWRWVPYDHQVRSTVVKRYGASALPARSSIIDWPVNYDELEPYHDKVEKLLGVAGKAGNLRGTLDARGNVFEGPRQNEYPLPPLRSSGFSELMADAGRSLGWHPFPGPAAMRSRAHDGKAACTYCGFCGSTGCYTDAKASTASNGIPAAEKTGHLKIVTHARVTHVNTDKDGRITGVLYLKGRQLYFQPAKVVLLAGYVFENSRLLLLSKSKAYPTGLSNNHGQVGKYFSGHGTRSVNVTALFPFNLNRFSGGFAQGTGLDDYNGDNFDHSGLGFIGGGNFFTGMEVKPIGMARTLPPEVPRWGSAWKKWVAENANRWASIYVQMDALPYEDNFIDLDPTYVDQIGMPIARITFDLYDNEKRAAAYFTPKVQQWFMEAGAIRTWTTPPTPNGVNTHSFGGTRMSHDPATGVVDGWGMSWEAPNLGILGGSTLSNSGGHNPTQTIQALAWRTADHIVKNWKTLTV